MHKYLILFVLSLTVSLSAKAEKNIIQQLFEAASQHDDQLQIAKERLEETKGQTEESFARMFPSVSFESSLSNTHIHACNLGPGCPDDSGMAQNSISLNQPIYNPALYLGYQISLIRSEQMGYEYGAAYLGLFDRLLEQYLNILAESDRVRTIQAQRDTLNQQLRSINARVAAGVASPIDLAEISASLQQAEVDLIQSRINLRVFYEGLSESTKLPIKNLPPVKRDLEMPPLENYDLEYWKDFALRENLSLLAARKNLAAAIEERKQSSRKYYPVVNLFSSYSASDEGLPDTSSDLTQSQIGVSLSIPLYTGGSRSGEAKKERARIEQARRQISLLETETKVVIPSLVRLISQGEKFIDAARQSMEAAQQSVLRTETLYGAGTRTISELLEDYERRTQTEQDYYATLYSHIRNYANFYIRTAQLEEEQLAHFYQAADLTNFDANTNPLLSE